MESSITRNDKPFERPKILMVDDKPENLIALERLLKNREAELFKANSGNEALQLTLHNEFALALIDIQMPELDGYELAELLRSDEKTAKMPFIFISAIYTDQMNIFHGYEKGAFSYITKPFEPQILLNKVDLFLDFHKQQNELKHRSQELMEVNKELEAFTYTVSHDLRAPLRALEGFSKALYNKYKTKLDKEGKRWLNFIIENSIQMDNLIQDILQFSRTSRQEIKPEKFDMTVLVREVFREQKKFYKDHKINFDAQDLPKAFGDKSTLRQVWVNLISNALKFSSKRDVIEITINGKKAGDMHHYSIQDNGSGFKEKYKDKVFNIFQRLHSPKDYEGTGVGMAIVKRIIDKHGGGIWVESKPDKGTTFHFELPFM